MSSSKNIQARLFQEFFLKKGYLVKIVSWTYMKENLKLLKTYKTLIFPLLGPFWLSTSFINWIRIESVLRSPKGYMTRGVENRLGGYCTVPENNLAVATLSGRRTVRPHSILCRSSSALHNQLKRKKFCLRTNVKKCSKLHFIRLPVPDPDLMDFIFKKTV
jgi:hypothetical protein